MDLSRNCPEELTPLNMRLWETQCDSALGKSTGALPIAGDADVLRSRGKEVKATEMGHRVVWCGCVETPHHVGYHPRFIESTG